MKGFESIAMIGAGNLAWHLAPELENAGHKITEVYSRKKKNASSLVKKLYDAEVNISLDFSKSEADIFIMAIADNAIKEIAPEIILPPEAILAHTSGAMPLDKLGYAATPNIGVFYPLQTFSKQKIIEWKNIPIFIEAENSFTTKTLYRLGKNISKNVKKTDAAKRLAIHVAAIFACNFPTNLMLEAEKLLKKENLNFDILKPLIAETFTKILAIGPAQALTGPASRGDLETLDRHMKYLRKNEDLAEVYRLISQQILDRNH